MGSSLLIKLGKDKIKDMDTPKNRTHLTRFEFYRQNRRPEGLKYKKFMQNSDHKLL